MTSNRGSQLTGADLYQQQKENKNFTAPAIICDGIQTPENLGSILRVADAVGSREIILLDSTVNLEDKKLSKISRSVNKHLNITEQSVNEFVSMHKKFKHLMALEITTTSVSLLDNNITHCDAVIIGHEAHGIGDELLLLCKTHIHLPMFGNNGSMNISHALSVFLYEWRRQS